MTDEVEIIEDAMVPFREWQEKDGDKRHCLDFGYDPNLVHPLDMPRALKYKGRTYIRTSHNSDTCIVCYKEGEIALPLDK